MDILTKPPTSSNAQELKDRAANARVHGAKVVVVQGLGFVGAAVAATVASARLSNGQSAYFVIGLDLGTPAHIWKIHAINEGRCPIISPDPELPRLLEEAVLTARNLIATSDVDAFGLADIIVVDINLDVINRNIERSSDIEIDMQRFRNSMREIGRRMQPDALVLIETTVPIGTCEKVVAPVLEEERRTRGITAELQLAHAYERVTPGPKYVDSIRSFYRTFSAINDSSATRAKEFLSSFIAVDKFPLRQLQTPAASELAKILENSYRAANIAFIQEWTVLAEEIGVNLFDVIDSIRLRKGTHDNIRQPGFGVGGYCLTKDSLLAQWSARELFHTDVELSLTLEALKINYRMPRHTVNRLGELLDGQWRGKRIALAGISYIAEVGDTRNSPSELFIDELIQAGAEVVVHDPYVEKWHERPHLAVQTKLEEAVKNCDALVFAVSHRAYLQAAPADLIKAAGRPLSIMDSNNIVSDAKAADFRKLGCRIGGVGKGHWRKLGYHLHTK